MFLYLLGSLFLLHAGYSSYEYHQLQIKLPSDIFLEVAIAVIIFMVGAFASISNESFLNIKTNEQFQWPEKFLKPIALSESLSTIEKSGNEYNGSGYRPDFINIREKRQEYAQEFKD